MKVDLEPKEIELVLKLLEGCKVESSVETMRVVVALWDKIKAVRVAEAPGK